MHGLPVLTEVTHRSVLKDRFELLQTASDCDIFGRVFCRGTNDRVLQLIEPEFARVNIGIIPLAVTQLVDVEWALVKSDSHHHHGFWHGGPEPLDRYLWLLWLQTGAERLKAVVNRHHWDILVFGCHTESVN